MITAADQQLAEDIDRELMKLDKLHSSPLVALRVMEIMRQEDYEMVDLAECLENDPALTASILRLVNSSYYGAAQPITSLSHALNYLGRRSVRLAVLSFGLVKMLVSGAPARLHNEYWRRSLTMGAAARRCAMLTTDHKVDPDTAFAAGLLADIGIWLWHRCTPKSIWRSPKIRTILPDTFRWNAKGLASTTWQWVAGCCRSGVCRKKWWRRLPTITSTYRCPQS